MRVVIFTVKNHIYANKIIKELLFFKGIKVIAIVESDVIYPNKNKISALGTYLKTSGLKYVISQIVKVLFFQFGSIIYPFMPFAKKESMLFPYRLLPVIKNMPVLIEKNINLEEFIARLSETKPDLFISVFFNQLFKNKILSIPRLGTINIHPALLPNYRGVSPTFWVLANGERRTGVTIHSITDDEVDRGEILAQKEIKILPTDTESSLYWRCVNEGIPLLKTILDSIAKRRKIEVKFKTTGGSSNYFSLPTKKAVENFKKNGRRFFTIRQLIYEK